MGENSTRWLRLCCVLECCCSSNSGYCGIHSSTTITSFEPSYLPFATNVYAAHKILFSVGVQSSPFSILPSTPEDFWTLYSKGPERKWQRVLSRMMEAKN